ncbi:MAG: redoxin domain-containing protein [Planctomycetes bacterium]|nr:redoxin domain-containing protein [Planctomycetota bacterium]
MLRFVTMLTMSISGFCYLEHAVAEQAADTSPAAKAYQSLLDEYEKVGSAREMTGKFFDFAEQHAKDPAAVDALAWIATHRRYRPEADRAMGLLQSDHLQSPRLGKAIGSVAKGATPTAERLLQAVLEKSPHADVQAQACYHLVVLLDAQLTLAEQIKQQPSLKKRAAQYYGKEMTDHLASLDAKQVETRKGRLCQTILKSFAKQPAPDGTLGQFAKRTLFAMRHLSVGKPAPDIEGADVDGRKFKLSDYRGKVVMISFWGHW